MSTKAAATKKATKLPPVGEPEEELLYLNPLDPRIIIDETLNVSRAYPYQRHELNATIASILEVGRVLQPVSAFPKGDSVQIYIGFGRSLATQAIAREGLSPTPVLLPVMVRRNVTEEQASDENLHENHIRRRTTGVDDAHAIARYEAKGLSQKEIAAKFKDEKGEPMSLAWVRQRKKILRATEKEQREWREKELKADTMIYLADTFDTPEERTEVYKAAEQETIAQIEEEIGVPIETAKQIIEEAEREAPPEAPAREIERRIKDKAKRHGGAAKAAAKKLASKRERVKKHQPSKHQVQMAAEKLNKVGKEDKRPRKLPDFTNLWEGWGAPGNAKIPASLRKLANAQLEWKEGMITTEEMENRLRSLLGVKLLKAA